MAQVDITINKKSYTITCDDGQEDRLRQLAKYLDMHVSRLVDDIGQQSDARLLLMASIIIADELSESLERSEKLVGENKSLTAEKESLTKRAESAEEEAATALAAAAERIEILAQRFEGPGAGLDDRRPDA